MRDEPDNRMVVCVLHGYEECPAKTPKACICYQYQRVHDDKFGNLYERLYQAKRWFEGEDD